MNRRLMVLTLGALLAVAWSSPASAAPFLDFNALSGFGTVSYAGGTNPLIATGINDSTVKGNGTPLNDGTALTITDGNLSFTTGAATGTDTWGAGTACPSLGNASCSITITGGIAGTTPVLTDPTTLLSGQILSADIVGNAVVFTTFVNFIDPTLAAFFGLSGGTTQWSSVIPMQLGLIGLPSAGAAFRCGTGLSCTVGSSDLETTPAPEPGSLLLLGAGLLLLATTLRSRATVTRI
jgi:hypothetical protein